jgi:Predicted bile acid beta-glucosidase
LQFSTFKGVFFESSTFCSTGDQNNKKTYPGQAIAGAVCAKTTVKAESQKDLRFVIAWDQPVIKFGAKSDVHYCR